jgi:TolA-binding protein
MKKLLSLAFIMGVLLTVTPLALAHGEQGATHQSNLDLSQEILEKVNDLQAEYYEKIDEVQDQLRVKNRELKKLYSNQEAKDKDIIKLRKEIKELDNKIFDLKTARYLELRRLVPAEKLGAIINQMHGNDQGMMGGNMMAMMKQMHGNSQGMMKGDMMGMMEKMHGNGQGMMNDNMIGMMEKMCSNSQEMMDGNMKNESHGHNVTEDSNMSNHTVENMNDKVNN